MMLESIDKYWMSDQIRLVHGFVFRLVSAVFWRSLIFDFGAVPVSPGTLTTVHGTYT